MNIAILEHIRTQAVVVARSTGAIEEGRSLIKGSLKDYPQLIAESLAWYEMVMQGLTREQVFKWISQGYTILMDAVPHRSFGHLWNRLNRLDTQHDNVLLLEELLYWTDEELAAVWQNDAKKEDKERF
ncbi:hypothetical protein [Sphingobacterium paludis]|nr:hypothetical protein [Sphingobacterium paludis]